MLNPLAGVTTLICSRELQPRGRNEGTENMLTERYILHEAHIAREQLLMASILLGADEQRTSSNPSGIKYVRDRCFTKPR